MEGCETLRAENENRQSRPGNIVIERIGCDTERSKHSVIGCDLYNGRLSGDKAVTLTANACSSSNHAGPSVIVLNDQGGSVMDVSDKAGCLRAQEHGHPPVICHVAAFMGGQGSKARGIAYSESVSPTIKSVMSGGNTIPDVVYCFEPSITKREGGSNPQPGDPCPTLVNDSRYYLVGVKEDDR